MDLGCRRAAAERWRGGGGEVVAVDGGVDQDDVLGVDQAGGAGGGDRVPAGSASWPPGARLAVMTARTPPGRSTRWQAAYTGAGSSPPPGSGRSSRPVAAGDGEGGLPGGGVPRREQSAGAAGPQPGRRGGAGGQPGDRVLARGSRPRTRRPAAAAASITAGDPSGAATRSPGTENASMARRRLRR